MTGAEAPLIRGDFRGPEGPLFHGCASVAEFFTRL